MDKLVVYGKHGAFLHSTRYNKIEDTLAFEYRRKTRAFSISEGQVVRVLAAYEALGYTVEYIYTDNALEFDVSLMCNNGLHTVNVEYNKTNERLSLTQYHLVRKGIEYD